MYGLAKKYARDKLFKLGWHDFKQIPIIFYYLMKHILKKVVSLLYRIVFLINSAL